MELNFYIKYLKNCRISVLLGRKSFLWEKKWEIFIELKPLLHDKKQGKMFPFLRYLNYVNYIQDLLGVQGRKLSLSVI